MIGIEFIGQRVDFPESGGAHAAQVQLERGGADQKSIVESQNSYPFILKSGTVNTSCLP